MEESLRATEAARLHLGETTHDRQTLGGFECREARTVVPQSLTTMYPWDRGPAEHVQHGQSHHRPLWISGGHPRGVALP
jgi:hypothetical protein